jgi:hypothetical protein
MAAELDRTADIWADELVKQGCILTTFGKNRLQELIDQLTEQSQQQATATSIRYFLGNMFESDRPTRGLRVKCWGLAFASGYGVEGITMTEAARRINRGMTAKIECPSCGHKWRTKTVAIGRAAISKMAVMWCKLLGLPESRYMKSENARGTYSQRQKEIANGNRTE